MSGTPNKKPKFDHSMARKPKFYKGTKNFLEVGARGFLATTNFREKECVRECYNILNSYADELYGAEQLDFAEGTESEEKLADEGATKSAAADSVEGAAKAEGTAKSASDADDDEDIATTLAKDIATAQAAQAPTNKRRRFNQVATGASNCVFIKSALRDPVRLAEHIMRDVAATRKNITRNVLRFVPVEAVCKANVVDIVNAAGRLFDRHFLHAEPTTYSVVYNRRCNNDLDRDEIIRELAKLVDLKNPKHKVNLKTAKTAILVEIVKGLCCLSVVPDYALLKKYNLAELVVAERPDAAAVAADEAEKVAEQLEGTVVTEVVAETELAEVKKVVEVASVDE